MFGKGTDLRAFQKVVDDAALAKSQGQKEYYRFLEEALLSELQERDKKGEPRFDKEGNPVMKPNTVENRIKAIFTIASFSSKFQKVRPEYLDVLLRQEMYIHDIQGVQMKNVLREAEGFSRISIARVLQVLSVDITKLSSPLSGYLQSMIAAESHSSNALESDTERWKTRSK